MADATGLARAIYIRDCLWCARPFVARHPRGVYCSDMCRTTPRTCNVYIVDCEMCGKVATLRKPGRFCSMRCKNAAKRDPRSRRNRGLVVGPLRAAIFQRDGWRCHLCGESITTREFRNRPGDPTIDHLVPRSKGGTNDPANLAAAHNVCNQRRGNKGAVQLRLAA